LSELGVNHRNMDELERSLPGIDGLVMPPKQAYVSTPPSWGIWHRYDAYLPEGKRWALIPSWETAEPGLLRWVQALPIGTATFIPGTSGMIRETKAG
jgi:hypothetical protein